MLHAIKIESTLFVPVNLSFSENLRCLKMPLLVGAISQKRWPSETCFVFAGQNVNSGKFKHLKYSENVKFTGTNYIDSILVSFFLIDFFIVFLSGFCLGLDFELNDIGLWLVSAVQTNAFCNVLQHCNEYMTQGKLIFWDIRFNFDLWHSKMCEFCH